MASDLDRHRTPGALAGPAAALIALAILAGCAPLPAEAPPTFAEEKRLLMEQMEAQRLRKEHFGDGTLGRCETSTGVVRLEGRRTRHVAVEGFDTRSCPP